MALTPEDIKAIQEKTGIAPVQASSTPYEETPEERDRFFQQLMETARQATIKKTEKESAESAGALFPAKTGESAKSAGLKAAGNIPSSALNLAKNFYQVLRHPIKTGATVSKATIGGLDLLLEKLTPLEGDEETKATARAVGTELMKRYGSMEALQRTATNDPIGFGFDIASLAMGPAGLTAKTATGAKVAAKVGEVAQAGKKFSIADPLMRSAAKQTTKVLEPTKEATKAQAIKIAPELAKRKVVAYSRASLEEKYAARLEEAGQAIDLELASMPKDTQVQIKPIIDSIEDSKRQFIVKGTEKNPDGPVIANTNAWEAADDLQQLILSVSKDGKSAPLESIRSIRMIWDKEVAASKGFTKDLKEGTALDLKKDATNAIRAELAKEFPNLDKLNKEYTLWKTADDVLNETIRRKAGREATATTKGAGAAGFIGGYASGGIKEAAISAATVALLVAAFRSTAWRTFSAAQKAKLAEAIYANNQAEVQRILTPMLGEQIVEVTTEGEAKAPKK